MQELFIPLIHPDIHEGYLISIKGNIKSSLTNDESYSSPYHSSNGYDYIPLVNKDMNVQLFPIDELICHTFLPVPDELQNKKVTIYHINGNNRDNDIDNLEWIEDIEEWKTVTYPGVPYGKYEISNHGNLKLSNGEMSVCTSINSRGYITSSLGLHQETKNYINTTRHKLVALHFIPTPDYDATEVNHIDGCKTNNHWKNLEWVTHKENMIHVTLTGLRDTAKGEDCGKSVIDNSLVHEICSLLVRFWGSAKSVYDYLKPNHPELSLRMVNHIKNKECWNHISDLYWTKEFISELVIKKIRKVCEKIVRGFLIKRYMIH